MQRRRLLLLPAVLLLLAACSDPPPVPDEGVPDPQATGLRDAINEPLDKAKAVEDADRERQAERDQALEDAGG
jgi:hypothetical protein